MIVVDSCAYLAVALPDEQSHEAEAMKQAIALGAIVPAIWTLEIENALRSAERSGRLTPEDSTETFRIAMMADIVVEAIGTAVRFGAEMALARTYDLSVYDATYLELAQRHGIPLMTVDSKLRAAAESLGLAWSKDYSPPIAPKRRLRKKKLAL